MTTPSRIPEAARGVAALLSLTVAALTLGGCGITSALVPWGGRAERPADVRPARRAEARASSPLERTREQAALAPADAYGMFRLAQRQLASDSSAAAERSLREALRREPAHGPSLALLSKLWFVSGRHTEAIRTLEDARARGASLPPAVLAGLALHYDAAGRAELARRTLSALPRDGRDGRIADPVEVYLRLRGEDPDGAAALAASTAGDLPRSAAARNNHGIALLRAGDPGRARRELERAVELDPALPGPYYNLAILEKYYAFDDAAAARWFARYRERAHDDPDGLAGALGTAAPSDMTGAREER